METNINEVRSKHENESTLLLSRKKEMQMQAENVAKQMIYGNQQSHGQRADSVDSQIRDIQIDNA